MRPYRNQLNQKLTITENRAGQFSVKGNLTFATIDQDILKSFGFLNSAKIISIDFNQVNTTDSAGLALMIEWLKYSKKHAIELHFKNIPQQLRALAKLSGFDQNLASLVEQNLDGITPLVTSTDSA